MLKKIYSIENGFWNFSYKTCIIMDFQSIRAKTYE